MTEPNERLKEWSHQDEWHQGYTNKGYLFHKRDNNDPGCFGIVLRAIVAAIVFATVIGLIYLMRKHGG